MSSLDNANPLVHQVSAAKRRRRRIDFEDTLVASNSNVSQESDAEDIDAQEIFDLIRSITDPEHPLTLEQLAVVSAPQITVSTSPRPHVLVEFTPTIPHCSMATLIGLSIRVRLLRALPERFKVDIRVQEGSHQSENAVNKQLNDKERVAAALENAHLLGVVQTCLATAHLRGQPIPTS